MHKTAERFWQYFNELQENIQSLAKEKFSLLKINPLHPSLHFKKVGKFWSIRIGLHYRALAIRNDNDFIWVWIGNHKEYDKMLKRKE